MRMDVDKAGRDRKPLGVDLLVAASADRTDRGDLAVLHGHVADERRSAVAVHDGAAANDDVVVLGHAWDLPSHLSRSVLLKRTAGKGTATAGPRSTPRPS